MASKRQKKKQATLKAQKALKIRAKEFNIKMGRKERRAAQRDLLLKSLRTPRMYEGKLENNADYYAAIKKYKENINKGLIKPLSTLDKYEAADAFMTSLSQREQSDIMRVANEKAEQIMEREREEAATFTKRITERYSF